jgi:hypothetical protein
LQTRTGCIHINAHQLAQQNLCILSVVEWVAFASTVPKAEVEEAIRAKRELSGFVVEEVMNLIYHKQYSLSGWVCLIGIRRGNLEFRNYGLNLSGIRADVIHEKAGILRESRVESKAQQSTLNAVDNQVADVQKRAGQNRAILNDLDGACLAYHEQSARAIIWLLQIKWLLQVCHYRLQGDGGAAAWRWRW